MAEETFIATVQIVLRPGAADTEPEACDWMHGLLSEHPEILDWAYLRIGGQLLSPISTIVDTKNYQEGDAL